MGGQPKSQGCRDRSEPCGAASERSCLAPTHRLPPIRPFGGEERINRYLSLKETTSTIISKTRSAREQGPRPQDKRRSLDIFTNRESQIIYIPIIIVTFFMFCGASWQIFWPATDAARYQCYAINFWFGTDALRHLPIEQCTLVITTPHPAFHSLPTEYPPLTLLAFSIPLLLPLPYYQFAFSLLMSLTSVFIYWVLYRYGPRGSALLYAFYIFLGALGLAQLRFDLLPTFCMLLCIIAAERKHWTAAYVALAFGVLLKIYPILLLPVLFLAEQQAKGHITAIEEAPNPGLVPILRQLWSQVRHVFHWNWHNFLLFLGMVIGITGTFTLLDFNGAVVSQLTYFAQRPIQIESTSSTLIWLAQIIGIPWLGVYYDFGSVNLVSDISILFSQAGTLLLILGFLYIHWLQLRGRMDITQAAIALLLLFITTGKVFSPQYLIWLIPLLAYAGAFDLFWLFSWGTISILTTILYIFFNSQLAAPTSPDLIFIPNGFLEIVAARNMLLVLLTLSYLFNWFHARQRKPLPEMQFGRQTRFVTQFARVRAALQPIR
jgi:hypothetical protein